MKQKQSKPAAYFDVPAMNTTAVASQFKQFRTEVADAIRAKKGTTESINPQAFAEEIASIETGGGGNFKYFSLSEYNDNWDVKEWAVYYGQYIKYQWHQKSDDESNTDSEIDSDVSGMVAIATATSVYDTTGSQIDFLAVAIDMDARLYNEWDNEWVDPKLVLEDRYGVNFSDLKEITKEEFYKIPTMFVLKLPGVPKNYVYEEGMTWGEWVNSEYNTAGVVIERDYIMFNGGFVSSEYDDIRTYDTVVNGSYSINYVE